MKRLKLSATALVWASSIAASAAAGANATANPSASCIGQGISFGATTFHEDLGDTLSGFAHTLQPLGQSVSATAQSHTNCPGG
jgi:hypothetical protein